MDDFVETSGISDSVEIEVKGPDPEHWGSEEDRIESDIADGKIDPLPDGVDIKGPDPEVWNV